MKQILHRGYFREIFRQLRVPGIISTAILLIPNLPILSTILISKATGENLGTPGTTAMVLLLMVYTYIAGFLLTFIAYNWLNHRSTSDFYHAIPVRRTQIYASTTLAVFLWMLIAVSATFFIQILIYTLAGMPVNFLAFSCVYINMLIGAIQIIGAVSLACAFSGTRFVNFFASFFILFVPRFLFIMFGLMILTLTNMLPLKEFSFLFNPSYNIFGMPYGSLIEVFLDLRDIEIDFANVGAIIYSFLHACILVLLGGFVFRRRKSELAGVHMRSRVLQAAIRVAFGLPLLLLLVLILQSQDFNFTLTLILVLFSFVFYCLYELISTKSAKKMVKAMPLYSVCIGIALVYFFLPQWIVKGALSMRVDTETVSGFSLVASENYIQTYSDIMSEKVVIEDPEGIRIIAKAYERAKNPETSYDGYLKKIGIRRNNGRSVTRRVSFLPNEYERLMNIAMQNEQYHQYQTEFPKGVKYCSALGLTQQEAAEIAAIYKDEYNQMDEQTKSLLNALSEFNSDGFVQRNLYRFTVQGFIGAETYEQSFNISECTPKSAQRLAQILNAKNGETFRSAVSALLNRLETGDITENTWNIGFSSNLYLYGYDVYAGGDVCFSKQEFPEYYEIMQLLADAEMTDDSRESVTVSMNDINGLIGETDRLENSITVFLKLSEADMTRIENLINQLYRRYGY